MPQRSTLRAGLLSFAQLVAASAAGVALYAGIVGWVQMERQAVSPAPASTMVHQQLAASASKRPETVGFAHPETRQARAARNPALPFPLPKAYGVYASSDGQVTALDRLPVSIPTARFNVSAEIREPGHTLVSGDSLKFVVFKRNLNNHAPQSASVKVVARVLRATMFVDGQPTVMPVEAEWRVRDRSYELKVSPVEDEPEMLVIEPNPGVVLSPGRYALVLNGEGYDFTVPGPVTALEQCLEQFQLQNGVVLSECPKS
jgi:hypothetical protein